jgi:hypothetical protein
MQMSSRRRQAGIAPMREIFDDEQRHPRATRALMVLAGANVPPTN